MAKMPAASLPASGVDVKMQPGYPLTTQNVNVAWQLELNMITQCVIYAPININPGDKGAGNG